MSEWGMLELNGAFNYHDNLDAAREAVSLNTEESRWALIALGQKTLQPGDQITTANDKELTAWLKMHRNLEQGAPLEEFWLKSVTALDPRWMPWRRLTARLTTDSHVTRWRRADGHFLREEVPLEDGLFMPGGLLRSQMTVRHQDPFLTLYSTWHEWAHYRQHLSKSPMSRLGAQMSGLLPDKKFEDMTLQEQLLYMRNPCERDSRHYALLVARRVGMDRYLRAASRHQNGFAMDV